MTASGQQTKIIALHGFLGLPSDWDSFDLGLLVEAVNLWSDLSNVSDFASWALRFNAQIRSLRGEKPILLGYSMGGRLAMQALMQAPELYRGGIIVSAHPGLTSDGERGARIASDQTWADRFRSEEWSQLMAAWTGQSVLKPAASASSELERIEHKFKREDLARAMEIWSLGRQPNFRPLLAESRLPLLFLSGAEDAKFTLLLSELKLAPSQSFRVIQNAGHRAPWEQPQSFLQAVREFLATIPDLC